MCNTDIEPHSPRLRKGVLFAATRSGGTLMDLSYNRYIALSPDSALIWQTLAEGHAKAEVVRMLERSKSVTRHVAESMVEHQLRLWQEAELVDYGPLPSKPLPHLKRAPDLDAIELDDDAVASSGLSLSLLASLALAEITYSRRLRNEGLATTLVRLQREAHTESSGNAMRVLRRTLRAYHALRHPYKQSIRAHDCLLRSLALAAVLRRNGLDADLCIGVIDLPFQAHAWVESEGAVLNETLTRRQQFVVIGRF
jgi:hypothetical protein